MTHFEEFHTDIYNTKFFKFFTWLTRLLLALAFLPSGFTKLLGNRFTTLPIENTIGFFFEALFRTGFYWKYIGFMQLFVALLLLIPKTSFFGAILYFPIVINILIIVTSLHFRGTPFIVGLMLTANIYLLLWDYPKLKRIISTIFEKN